MATIFLSYRRTDSPQAMRVNDWLVRRFGADAVFMDVEAIPIAVSFPDFIKQAIADSKILIALIGSQRHAKMDQVDDPVRMEIEAAIANNVTVLPVLSGNTPMPNADELPASISTIARQNAVTVGVLRDFDTHMQTLLPKIESILGTLARQSIVISDPMVIDHACDLSFWSQNVSMIHRVTGWVLKELEQTPLISDDGNIDSRPTWDLKIRRGDEDARQIWKMITDRPLQLSLAYIATISPKSRN
jgi:hypothetical protein